MSIGIVKAFFDGGDLKLWPTVKEAYKALWQNKTKFIQISLVAFVLSAIFSAYGISLSVDHEAFSGIFKDMLAPLMLVPAITAWHRFMLNAETSSNGLLRFPVTKMERAYTFKAIGWFLIALIILVVSISPVMFFKHLVIQIFTWAALFFSILAITRLLLVLPAASIGKEMSFKDVWQASRGYGFKMLLISLIATLPFGLLYFLTDYLVMENLDWLYTLTPLSAYLDYSSFGEVLKQSTLTLFNFLGLGIEVGVLSLMFRHIVLDREEEYSGKSAVARNPVMANIDNW